MSRWPKSSLTSISVNLTTAVPLFLSMSRPGQLVGGHAMWSPSCPGANNANGIALTICRHVVPPDSQSF